MDCGGRCVVRRIRWLRRACGARAPAVRRKLLPGLVEIGLQGLVASGKQLFLLLRLRVLELASLDVVQSHQTDQLHPHLRVWEEGKNNCTFTRCSMPRSTVSWLNRWADGVPAHLREKEGEKREKEEKDLREAKSKSFSFPVLKTDESWEPFKTKLFNTIKAQGEAQATWRKWCKIVGEAPDDDTPAAEATSDVSILSEVETTLFASMLLAMRFEGKANDLIQEAGTLESLPLVFMTMREEYASFDRQLAQSMGGWRSGTSSGVSPMVDKIYASISLDTVREATQRATNQASDEIPVRDKQIMISIGRRPARKRKSCSVPSTREWGRRKMIGPVGTWVK